MDIWRKGLTFVERNNLHHYMTRRKKIFLGVAGVLLVALSVFCIGGWSMFGEELKAMKTLHMVGDSAYSFTFKGDYGFKAFLEQGGAKNDDEMAKYIQHFLSHGYMDAEGYEVPKSIYGCTSFQGNDLLSRNFDYPPSHQFVVLVRTEPKDGYRSISTTTWSLMFGGDWHPIAGMDGMPALGAVYIPLDGVNEKGLCVADLVELDGDSVGVDTKKPDLPILASIRLVLDYAATVDEAIALLAKYDIHPSVRLAHHLALSDGKRNVVVEWDKGQMHVTDNRAVTNHCLWRPQETERTKESFDRLKRVAALQPTTQQEGLAAVRAAANDFTLWSVVYDRRALKGTWYIRRHWDKPLSFAIDGE